MPFRGKANHAQIVALQTLFSAWHSRSISDAGDARVARLSWASTQLGRDVDSFSNLTGDEARQLIDVLKQSLGQPLTRQPQSWNRVRTRDRAQEAGTAGRKGARSAVIHLASADDLARIDEALQRLGWTKERFEGWLKSGSSPLKKKDGVFVIRTVAEANRVWWALKAMMIRGGVWKRKRAV
jgi:hypothetical protein